MPFGSLILLAATWTLSVDTGSPLHVTTDPEAVRPRVEVHSAEGVVPPKVVRGTLRVENYFGDSLEQSLVATNGSGTAEIDLRRVNFPADAPSRLKGVWTVTAVVDGDAIVCV